MLRRDGQYAVYGRPVYVPPLKLVKPCLQGLDVYVPTFVP